MTATVVAAPVTIDAFDLAALLRERDLRELTSLDVREVLLTVALAGRAIREDELDALRNWWRDDPVQVTLVVTAAIVFQHNRKEE